MAYFVGAMRALAVGGFATAVGLDRDRALIPRCLIVVASYHVLFAVVGDASHPLLRRVVGVWRE